MAFWTFAWLRTNAGGVAKTCKSHECYD